MIRLHEATAILLCVLVCSCSLKRGSIPQIQTQEDPRTSIAIATIRDAVDDFNLAISSVHTILTRIRSAAIKDGVSLEIPCVGTKLQNTGNEGFTWISGTEKDESEFEQELLPAALDSYSIQQPTVESTVVLRGRFSSDLGLAEISDSTLSLLLKRQRDSFLLLPFAIIHAKSQWNVELGSLSDICRTSFTSYFAQAADNSGAIQIYREDQKLVIRAENALIRDDTDEIRFKLLALKIDRANPSIYEGYYVGEVLTDNKEVGNFIGVKNVEKEDGTFLWQEPQINDEDSVPMY